MWKRFKNNFDSGIEQIRWFSSLFSERLKIEYLVMKLLYRSEQLERKRDEFMKTIGRRVYELKGYTDRYILKDGAVIDALSEIEKIDSEIDLTKKKASEISSTI
ncbi:MAG: hypothetical protein AB1390_12640 [Nitrospirota bacterium]